ncbi:MAG: ABC transporter permease [Christensenellales bacterium]|jgi:putative aldouronate transport system permease protein
MTATSRAIGGRKKRRRWELFFVAFPLMCIVLVFNYVPLFGWALSVFEYKPGTPLTQNEFVGLKYFQMILNSKDIRRVLTNTMIFSGLNFVLMPLPMLFAILLNEIQSTGFKKVTQTLTTLPHFISWIIVYSLAFAIFSTDGLLNTLLSMLGMKQQKLLQDRNAVYPFQTFISQWKSLGWNSIIYIAAITGIDQELYEAAAVDGAGKFRCAIHITLPGLMPTFLVVALLAVANFINSGLDQYFMFQNSVVMKNIEVIDLYTYRVGLKNQDYSYATAVGMCKSLISLVMLFVTNAIAKKVRGESIV